MTTRTYDFILTVTQPDVIAVGDTILSNVTATSGEVVGVDAANANIKVKVANVNQEFVVGENARSVFNLVASNAISVAYSNSSSTTVNGNAFIINGATNTFSLPSEALSLSNVTLDNFDVFINNRIIPKQNINFPSATLGDTGFDINPISPVTSGTTFTKKGLRESLTNNPQRVATLLSDLILPTIDASIVADETTEFEYEINYDNWISANAFAVDVRVDTGNNETIPFTAAAFSEQKNGANFAITNIINSNYIRERNAFVQNPVVRLYSIYYPGEWYKPNEVGNPTNDGEGRRWPDGFPLRFAEVRGDLNADVTYNVEFGGVNYTPMPINSGGLEIDSSGKINEISIDISNFDGLITQIAENPDLVGNNTSNACFAVVNGEVVTGIDPRTIPTGATYAESEHATVLAAQRTKGLNFNQSVRDSYGVDNASFTISTTADVGGEWKREKMDSRDLLGAVVEIRSTFANFLDYWPEYARVDAAFANVIEVSTALPYRVGDNVKSRSNSFIATIDAIEENRFIFTNAALEITVGDPLLIENIDSDDEAYIEDVFKIDSLSGLDEKVATFSLTSWLQFFKLRVPKRKYYKNTCQWIYKGEECQYPGPAGGTIPGTSLSANSNPIAANNQIAGSVQGDECGKSFESCQIRNNTIHFGGFPGTGRTIPK
tara:strand:- start:6110 stop:8098 length:1989 start_codon:yes stop_codon:yes gene_type:complete